MNLNDIYKIILDGLNNGNELKTYTELISSYNGDDWRQYVDNLQIPPDVKYLRTHIYSNELIDIYIIAWPVNSVSGVHDHAPGGCILKILDGKLEETIYSKQFEVIQTSQISTDEVSFMINEIGYHNIKNISDDISVSLHVYNPGSYRTVYFNV